MRKLLFFSLVWVLAVISCSRPAAPSPEATETPETPGVYYWRTVLDIDSAENAFLKEYGVGHMYLRMFDVVRDDEINIGGDRNIPVGTLRVTGYMEELRDIDITPVVYITLESLKEARRHEGVLARNIVTRVKNMCSYNSIDNVGELQLDCDWTASTEESFFALCDSVRKKIAAEGLPWKLSSTIRLHQLARKAPPVHHGVLMVYNTGDFSDPDADNSILSKSDVEPYVKHLRKYPLSLDVAYPVYSWQLLFHKRQFRGLLGGVDVTDTLKFRPLGHNKYEVLKDFPYNNTVLLRGDVVRTEMPSYDGIMEVKQLIDENMGGRRHNNILYHLDMQNFSKFTKDEIRNIFAAE